MTGLNRRTLAHHEAAHTVVAAMWGIPCIGVLIDGPELEPRGLNGVSMTMPTGNPVVDISVAAAGYRAQLRLDPDDHEAAFYGLGLIDKPEGTAYVWSSDYEHMLLAATPGYRRYWKGLRASGNQSRVDRFLARGATDTDWMFDVAADVGRALADPCVWAKVTDVAEALMSRGRLTGADVRALVP